MHWRRAAAALPLSAARMIHPDTRRSILLAAFPAAVLVITLGASCARVKLFLGVQRCPDYDFRLPPGFPLPQHPPDICVTPASAELGRRLFYDERLSGNEQQSCSTCHVQNRSFTDGRVRSIGSTGRIHPRNSMSLANVGYFSTFTWQNSELIRLDNQTLIPFFAENTKTTIEELMITGKEHIVADRLRSDESYGRLFSEVFPGQPIDITRVSRALAAFQTTLISARSPYDRGTMTESAKRGEMLFRSERTGCFHCHGGPHFNLDDAAGKLWYQNVGLYNVTERGDYPDHALHGDAAERQTQGLFVLTGDPRDRGKFRTPSVRNTAVSGPYMHDGSMADLDSVIEHFNTGGRVTTEGPFAGDGRKNPNKDPRVRALSLTPGEKADLRAFLEALTDDCFLNDPAFSDPEKSPPILPDHCK